ncbi:rhodanese-like domain-containing protein [Fulvivirga sp. 29W222]|uniref:Rhodanese-like domain-containing protein n=1 Tax=Fulvivirga marina TaxID=2494733 RepID=A0A937FXQ7_9BACT|nr:rhodanese-like domain-containing protein [Fulvivirga marina]MBL6446938.1 rhodanese-like domain-containing protein [Fulvivirga marina]
MNRLYLVLVLLMSTQCMGQKDFDAKLNSLLSKSVPFIYTNELTELTENEDEILILDTRSEKEFQVSHIPNAIFIDYEDFSIESIKGYDKKSPVIVYCSVGYRSEKIGEELQELGFSDVRNLYGGIFDWKNKGYEVVNNMGKATDSVHTYNENWSKWLKEGVKVYE